MKKLIALVAMSLCGIAFAADVTWTGEGQSPAWSDAGNWSAEPQAEDVLVVRGDVKADSDDILWANGFAGIKIDGAASRLTVSPMTKNVEMKVPLSGDGMFATTNAAIKANCNLSLLQDNSAFMGPFLTDRVGLTVRHPYALGLTNSVTAKNLNTSAYLRWPYCGAGVDPKPSTVYSNCFTYVGAWPYANQSGGLHYTGLIDCGAGDSQASSDSSIGYMTYYDCLVTNTTAAAGEFRLTQYQAIGADGVVSLGSTKALHQQSGHLYVYGRILTCRELSLDAYVHFCRTNAIAANVQLRFGQSYPREGHIDLNGYDQECGKFCVQNGDMDGKNPHAYTDCLNGDGNPKAWLSSESGPAKLTIRGAYSCMPDNGNYTMVQRRRLIYPVQGHASLELDTTNTIATAAEMRLTSAFSTTDGGLYARRGKIVVESMAKLPNLSVLEATNVGEIEIENGPEINEDVTVKVADSATLCLAEGLVLKAKTAFVGMWLEPGTYGSAEAVAAAGDGKALDRLTGLGLLTVAEYGGPKGLMLLIR